METRLKGKHLLERNRFENDIINTRKKMWFGTTAERVASKKALLTSKRIADLMDDQATLWKEIKKQGGSKGSRFSANLHEIEKRTLQLQFYLLELARELQRDIEKERNISLSKDIKMIKKDLERHIHGASETDSLKHLRKDIDQEFTKIKKFNVQVQATLKLLDPRRVVFDKIALAGHSMIPLMQTYLHKRIISGNGPENARQKAHDTALLCKKINDDILLMHIIPKRRR